MVIEDPFGEALFPELVAPVVEARPQVLRPQAAWPPEGAEFVLSMMAFGEVRPAGSKSAFVPTKGKMSDGKPIPVYYSKHGKWQILVNVVDSSGAAGKKWRKQVAAAAREVWGDVEPMREQAMAMELVFVLDEPATHFGTGKNAAVRKPGQPAVPIVMPDTLKLARSVEDALTGLIYDDDSRIVDQRHRKVYAERGEAEHVELRLWRLPTTQNDHLRAEVAPD